ncbi:MAG TPA: enoyl-CoA hydratase-related protein [Caulobacterales bacterium]|nr:enoyl-CoA hydratase-related protein [Caulobacterales bacterium]
MSDLVSTRTEGDVCVVTIDNPPVNAFHPDVAEALIAAFDALERCNPRPRAVVLTGAGRYFMAGGDIRFFQTLDETSAERYARRIQICQEIILHFHAPVIAAIHGAALGGGCELMMACDIRVAAEDAVFGQPEVTLGVIPGAGGTQNLPRLVPIGTAKKLLFTGERISATEALRIGLVDVVARSGDALNEAMALAQRIAKNAPLAVAAAKRAVNVGLELNLSEALRLEARLLGELFRSEDVKEGVAAFVAKRPAEFQGK